MYRYNAHYYNDTRLRVSFHPTLGTIFIKHLEAIIRARKIFSIRNIDNLSIYHIDHSHAQMWTSWKVRNPTRSVVSSDFRHDLQFSSSSIRFPDDIERMLRFEEPFFLNSFFAKIALTPTFVLISDFRQYSFPAMRRNSRNLWVLGKSRSIMSAWAM